MEDLRRQLDTPTVELNRAEDDMAKQDVDPFASDDVSCCDFFMAKYRVLFSHLFFCCMGARGPRFGSR